MNDDKVLFARQPIVDGGKSLYGYELLFRPAGRELSFDGDHATSEVLLNAFTELGQFASSHDCKLFVNFTEQLLKSPPPFDKDKLVVEILENISLTPEVIAAIRHLSDEGYSLALDDYVPDSVYDEILPYVDIVKLEVPAIASDIVPHTISRLKSCDIIVLAEKVETYAEFRRYQELGCDLFQGYFFSKPELVTGRKLPQSKLAVVQLVAEVQNPDNSMSDVVATITKDPGLSVKLLELVNSAAFRRSQSVDSIHKAVTLLGLDKIRAWATLLALSNIEDKPEILTDFALMRAFMCEKMAEVIEPEASDTYFTIGLLSCLDGFFDTPLNDIIARLPLGERVLSALLQYKGKPGLALTTALYYERSKLGKVRWDILEKLGVDSHYLNDAFQQSVSLVQQHKRNA